MKNIVLVLGLVLCMAGFGNSAAAEDEVTSLRGKGRSKLEFKPGFWKTQKKQDEAKAAAYEKAIEAAKRDVLKQCATLAVKKGSTYSVPDNFTEKWEGTMGRCDHLVNLNTKKHAFTCTASVKANCILIAQDPRMNDQSVANQKCTAELQPDSFSASDEFPVESTDAASARQ
ncbi:MAG TPA: hypothetical protein DCS07_10895 [Bdellovibrionales bacterium]|nr:MAG: hypothetical protein A2Z97_02220 [Bdellovibrionales bacterium GWB1_52_6]OFZ04080.1 MAG: hypothetical protein A2X97_14860 [Bdellovibrionales bacterium GWA1_52_35]OFZ41228.1 MAG: hypothetical protein A2070_03870 [Bdellovibrionales bacterium GWC1_52_8]HAR43116.1 hypothetical protein [Bdellovibrionales bacterium]HCM39834.1 hypothetical protein [Bdellovibrionales bacterium]